MVQLSVTNHVVKRYRERVKADELRGQKSDKSIRGLIIRSIKSNPAWSLLEDFVSDRMDLFIDLSENGVYFGQHELVFCKSGKGRSYCVVTLY